MTEKISDGIYRISVKGRTAGAYGTESAVFNSYIIRADKNILIDTVPIECCDEFFSQLEDVISINELDSVICTHTEPEGSGSVAALLALRQDIEIYATAAGLRNIKELVNAPVNECLIKNGAVEDHGSVILEYIMTPNLHWPDTVCVYEQNAGILFSGELFGKYDAGSAEDYYRGRFAPFGDYMKNALSELKNKNISAIYPSVGEPADGNAIDSYREFCCEKYKNGKSAVIFYASNYGYTRQLAYIAAEVLNRYEIEAEVISAPEIDTDAARDKIQDADAVLFGSPTVNRNVTADIWRVITSAQIVKSGKTAFTFGSYGWSGEAVSIMDATLRSMRFALPVKGCRCILNPSAPETESFCRAVGKIAEYINASE